METVYPKTENIQTIKSSSSITQEKYIEKFFLSHGNGKSDFGKAKINFKLNKDALVRISIRNFRKDIFCILLCEPLERGFHSVELETSQLPDGIYVYKIEAGTYSVSRKVMIIK